MAMEGSTICILVVDDYEPWRRFVSTRLHKQPELQVMGEALDGLEGPTTTPRPNLARHRASFTELNRSRAPNPRAFPEVQNSLHKRKSLLGHRRRSFAYRRRRLCRQVGRRGRTIACCGSRPEGQAVCQCQLGWS